MQLSCSSTISESTVYIVVFMSFSESTPSCSCVVTGSTPLSTINGIIPYCSSTISGFTPLSYSNRVTGSTICTIVYKYN